MEGIVVTGRGGSMGESSSGDWELGSSIGASIGTQSALVVVSFVESPTVIVRGWFSS